MQRVHNTVAAAAAAPTPTRIRLIRFQDTIYHRSENNLLRAEYCVSVLLPVPWVRLRHFAAHSHENR